MILFQCFCVESPTKGIRILCFAIYDENDILLIVHCSTCIRILLKFFLIRKSFLNLRTQHKSRKWIKESLHLFFSYTYIPSTNSIYSRNFPECITIVGKLYQKYFSRARNIKINFHHNNTYSSPIIITKVLSSNSIN